MGAIVSVIITLVVVLLAVVSVGASVAMAWYFRKSLQGQLAGLQVVNLAGPMVQPAGPPRMKQTRCRTCGGNKVKPSKTAYVYCDFCGALADYDFRLAMSRGSAPPGPAYEALQRQEKPLQDMALARRDLQALRGSLARVFDGHMRACPASYTPRLGDPEYRRKLLDYTVECHVSAKLDPETARLEQGMMASIRGIAWMPSLSGMRVEPSSFWTMTQAWLAHDEHFRRLASQHVGRYPETINDDILKAMGTSLFAQGWLGYLDSADQERLLGHLGLQGDYLTPAPVQTLERHCGGCSKPLEVVSGAWKTVCEGCGAMNDTRQPELQCNSCGAPFCIPAEHPHFACPYCRADVRR